MRCIRCGNNFDEKEINCPNCGMETSEIKKYQKVSVLADKPVDRKEKIILIDNPILTFIFGIISLLLGVMNCLYSVMNNPAFIFILFFVVSFTLAYIYSMKETRLKLKPVRTVGLIMAYIGLFLTLYGLIMFLLRFLNL